METIDLTDGFTLKWIAQSWEHLSTEHSVEFGSTLLFGDRFGIQLPFSTERRLKLFIVGCYPLIRFPMKSVPTDPEEVYQALLRQTQGPEKGRKRSRTTVKRFSESGRTLSLCFLRPPETALGI